jgi:hypothetical protein
MEAFLLERRRMTPYVDTLDRQADLFYAGEGESQAMRPCPKVFEGGTDFI